MLRGARLPCGLDLSRLDVPGGGKMLGVLVVATPDGRVGYLRGFSGMLAGQWHVEGFVPPLFDTRARDAVWPAGEAELDEMSAERCRLVDGPEASVRAQLAALSLRQTAEHEALKARLERRRQLRHEARRTIEDAAGLHALAQESRGDDAERRRLAIAQRGERQLLEAELALVEAQRILLEQRRAERSRELLQQLWDTYDIANARGERRSLCDLFAPLAPPGGAGDCAGPKLLGHAFAHGLQPLALAELWWGATPLAGGRQAGSFYPACRGNCGVVLPHMLAGLSVEEAPIYGHGLVAPDEPRTVHEDEHVLVVDKPAGLLSVPGRHALLRDSVQSRLRARHPEATGPLVVHRLDLDTSGLLLVGKTAAMHAALQKQFAGREVEKRYVALLDGQPVGEEGVVELALRGDLTDRPRQIHDPLHGKRARTEWRVLARSPDGARVALFPHTGRTHQLRVHAAHPLGLAAPIAGDRLYGAQRGDDSRLMLHAEGLTFTHPHTKERITVKSQTPF